MLFWEIQSKRLQIIKDKIKNCKNINLHKPMKR